MPAMDSNSGMALRGVAADSHSLDQLRTLAEKDPSQAIKQVSTQFEALFLQMVLKSMREATPKSGMLDSNEQQTYTSMLDEQLAQKMASGGTGLGAVIARQLSRNLPVHPAGAVTGAAGAAAPAPGASPLRGAALAGPGSAAAAAAAGAGADATGLVTATATASATGSTLAAAQAAATATATATAAALRPALPAAAPAAPTAAASAMMQTIRAAQALARP
jgi:flagellar protein FlgJ